MEIRGPRAAMPAEEGRYGRLCARTGTKVCSFWLEGRCTRNPCRFLHVELPPPRNNKIACRHPAVKPKSGGGASNGEGSKGKDGFKPEERLCQHWASGISCVKGDKCEFRHSWSRGEGFSLLAKLDGHDKGIAGIAFPSGLDKLYTGSNDGMVKIWDCHTGQCSDTVNVGSEVGCLISEGPWVFAGLRNVIKAWNVENGAVFDLQFSSGLVFSMVVDNNMLFAGCQNGDIMVWRGTSLTSPPQLLTTLKGHTRAVVSLVIGANRLYTGSVDHTIRVWDIQNLVCITTLKGHTNVVMSVLCWDNYLLSCSLDQTIKVWAATSPGGRDLEVIYTHNEDHEVLALKGMHDMEGKPILLCSCDDDTVHLYELPTFAERGRIYSRCKVLALQVAPTGGLFFTGDGVGTLNVWKWSGELKQGML
ncbi:zinc finger CCCH domain-containing protein 48-like isoform X2 [Punica granatum]|uniref:Zinc finger CCCH domain-containing protein 48-like isoform X1 n=2 Tax=Punica granatum TaxID=22663 RepID=A0A6P8DQV6_PUNGR|nr:zinc finger CCCH domain-containing protein 48-like isoform X1 [Punica granatum]XP_031399737.1 zinc finger CCCH domain-containing protein 48-like isoform X2 [Punica granatum]